jgi:hypothetical protein
MKLTGLVKKMRLNSFYSRSNTGARIAREAPLQVAGGGPPIREGPQRRPLPPPYPSGLIIGVCGKDNPLVYFLEQDHIDEIPAVAGAVFYATGPLINRLQEKLDFLFKEEFGNKFIEFKGEWIETEHTGHVQLPNGGWKQQSTVSYCYVLTNDWLRNVVGYKGVASLGTVTESDEANELLQTVRGRGLAPLYHWQSRLHVRVGQVITHRELPDGYLLDNRIWHSRIPNVVPKCVPSLLDIKTDRERWRDHPYVRYL